MLLSVSTIGHVRESTLTTWPRCSARAKRRSAEHRMSSHAKAAGLPIYRQ